MLAFDGTRGDRLTGRLDVPDGTPRAVVLLAHYLGGGNEGPAAAAFARCFTEQGLAVLSVDCAAGGGAAGETLDGPALGADDLAAAAAQLRAAIAAPAILVGHSLAGPAILAAAGRIPDARAVATVGAPAGDADRTAALHRPLLIIHAPDDLVVSVDQARVIFEAARHPKSFVSLDGADHRLTRPADAAYAASVIAAWAARYLAAPDRPDRGTRPAVPAEPGVVVVSESQARPFGQRISVGGHELTADEPASVGGADTGPSPYELLLGALGACTAITVRIYADRKGWPLRHVTVRLRHERIHARDCAECETATGQLDHIKREIGLDGDLTGDQRARLLDMAERCPVHRTLHSEVHTSTAEA
jgi:putative redox protein